MAGMDAAVSDYIAAIPSTHRPLFDRLNELILHAFPQVELELSYKMPTYRVDPYRLYVGVWKHGLSLYGWDEGRDDGFTARHPELSSGRGTLRLTLKAAKGIDDGELSGLVRAALGG
ncbi:MAG: DUF1801 domain-containing protein [Actinomycetota bacterium]|nr:DUF1801 domain-containing protein [Actinomycetota bacterium]